MSSELDFYAARRDQLRAEADAAVLDNVRDRCERAAAAFAALHDRAERARVMREKERVRKEEAGLVS